MGFISRDHFANYNITFRKMITNDTIAKGWFLTYPKCEVTPQACLEYLKESHDIVEYVIAQELH